MFPPGAGLATKPDPRASATLASDGYSPRGPPGRLGQRARATMMLTFSRTSPPPSARPLGAGIGRPPFHGEVLPSTPETAGRGGTPP
jgi:hypothetical protein